MAVFEGEGSADAIKCERWAIEKLAIDNVKVSYKCGMKVVQ